MNANILNLAFLQHDKKSPCARSWAVLCPASFRFPLLL